MKSILTLLTAVTVFALASCSSAPKKEECHSCCDAKKPVACKKH